MTDAGVFQIAQASGREPFAIVVQEQRVVVGTGLQLGAHLSQMLVDPDARARVDRDHPILAAFALLDHQHAPLEIRVIELQAHKFEASDAA